MKIMVRRPRCTLVGADLSAAEVRAAVDASRDQNMLDAYNHNKDLYALIASKLFNTTYDNCLEFYPEGTKVMIEGKEHICGKKEVTNKEGKQRRSASKRCLLGSMYGRGAASIAEQIGCSVEEAKKIMDNFYKEFPRLKEWIEETKAKTAKVGYVDDALGRRRHLPNALLPKYEYKSLTPTVNPFLNCPNEHVDPALAEKYDSKLKGYVPKREFAKISKEAEADGISIVDNGSKIAEALRESVNWCCQAVTATWIKKNMLAVAEDPEINRLGGRILLTIHDELQLSVPAKNSEAVKERLTRLMSDTCRDICCVPLPSDGTIEWSGAWYMTEMETLINAHFNAYREAGMSDEEACEKVCEEESELSTESIRSFLFEGKYLDY